MSAGGRPAEQRDGRVRGAGRRFPRRRARRAGRACSARLRAYFLTGVIVTAPISITIFLVWQFVTFVDSQVGGLIPERYNPETYLPFSLPGLGLLVMLAFLTLVGMLTAGLAGPHAGPHGRAPAVAHAGRAQRLRHAQADLRDRARAVARARSARSC